MKHAGAENLDRIEGLLQRIRAYAGLREKSRGVFYVKQRAALHFHVDPAGLFADLRLEGDWDRLQVNTKAQQAALLARIAKLKSA